MDCSSGGERQACFNHVLGNSSGEESDLGEDSRVVPEANYFSSSIATSFRGIGRDVPDEKHILQSLMIQSGSFVSRKEIEGDLQGLQRRYRLDVNSELYPCEVAVGGSYHIVIRLRKHFFPSIRSISIFGSSVFPAIFFKKVLRDELMSGP